MIRLVLALIVALIPPAALAQTPLQTNPAETVAPATSHKPGSSKKKTPFSLPAQNFSDLAQAEKACGDKNAVVWLNLNSGKFFLPGNRYFGKTKQGAYACTVEAEKSGFVGAKQKNKS